MLEKGAVHSPIGMFLEVLHVPFLAQRVKVRCGSLRLRGFLRTHMRSLLRVPKRVRRLRHTYLSGRAKGIVVFLCSERAEKNGQILTDSRAEESREI
jgi:hypothetical protein